MALKLLCTIVVLVIVLAFYLAPVLRIVIALQPPEWTIYVLMAIWLGLSAFTYTAIKLFTNLGRYLCDWPRYY